MKKKQYITRGRLIIFVAQRHPRPKFAISDGEI